MVKRVYVVKIDDVSYLVRAVNRQQAVAHVARNLISARLASQDDLIDMIHAGHAVEDATEKEEELIESSESPAN